MRRILAHSVQHVSSRTGDSTGYPHTNWWNEGATPSYSISPLIMWLADNQACTGNLYRNIYAYSWGAEHAALTRTTAVAHR